MKLYSENENYKLYHGNMLDMLEVIEPNSIDSVVCDPPYELNFMGKGWDNSGIAFQKETWQKCYEVLKPGGYLLAFGGSRTFHRIAVAIEDAGFEIRDTIMWLYGSGFPKSMDISKQIDKRGGESTSWFGEYLKKTLKEKNMTYSDLAKHFLSKTGGITGCVHNWVEGKNMPTIEQFNKICKILDLPFKKMEEAEREVIGVKKSQALPINDSIGNWGETREYYITLPSTDLAKQWQGWGTALKPSFEPIIVARKPFKGSLVDNVLEYGVGGINIDECRVETNEDLTRNCLGRASARHEGYYRPCFEHAEKKVYGSTNGRFPANTILTYDETDFDEVCGGFPDTKSQYRNVKESETLNKSGTVFETSGYKNRLEGGFNDSGSASRYFYCAKASKRDRDEGLDNFEEKKTGSMMANIGGNMQLGGASLKGEPKEIQPKKNTHPTVKPTELMQYLIRLVSPNGATILDPFNGSGSTGKAVMYENKERGKNYKYIGIELTEEYLPISKARIEYVCNMQPEANPQISIFDLEVDNE